MSVPDAIRSQWQVGPGSVVYLSMAVTNTKPGPRQPPREKKKEEEGEKEEKKKEEGKKEEGKPAPKPKTPAPPKEKEKPDLTPVELTVEVTDAAGHVARLPLDRFGIARHPLDARIYRREGRDAQRFSEIFELVAQTFVMPLADFARAAPDFDPRQLSAIRLVFDRTVAGTVVVEHIGLSTSPEPAFLAAPVNKPGISTRRIPAPR